MQWQAKALPWSRAATKSLLNFEAAPVHKNAGEAELGVKYDISRLMIGINRLINCIKRVLIALINYQWH